MTQLAIDPRRLRGIARDLHHAEADITAALRGVETPTEYYPWHRLVERAVETLTEDAHGIALAGRRLGDALDEAVTDLAKIDQQVADYATGRR